MELITTMIGGLIGTLVSVLWLAYANKFGFLPKEWRFFEDGVATLQKNSNRLLLYGPRFILGGAILPVVFLYVWGPDGLLGISIANSIVLSSLLLALIEFVLMTLGILLGAFKQPKNATIPLILVTLIGHLNLGFWIGIAASM
ncbi:MAG: hypothetical protein HeimC2_09200 [Candidatus Heimdallarchaeota archaeon LC_2]|nr:MAG: hypothetical protein HeimC2_09200 [Candidatus Heimdallarchaeota archaeon LC_2]